MTFEERKEIFEKEVVPHIPKELSDYMLNHGFLTQSASTKFHGVYEGGLFDHSIQVMRNLLELTEKLCLVWENPERAPWLIGIAHDLCKIDAYEFIDGQYFYNKNTSYKNEQHGMKSVRILRDILGKGYLTTEEESCIAWHMGAFCDKEWWSYYSKGVESHQNVLWTHTADMMAAHIQNV